MPGEYTKTGEYIRVAHGSRWGIGIYFSPSLQYSDSYSFKDSLGYSKMFVSLALLGKPYDCSNLKKDKISLYDRWNVPGYDSHISPNGNEYVIFDSAQVLPTFLITYSQAYSTLDK
jgi:hypothetical protein